MKVITTNEASKLWNITPRRVAMLAAQGRIPGAKYVDNRWLIPADSEKPSDTRKKYQKTMKLGNYVFPIIIYMLCNDYSVDDLKPEEKCLYDAFMCYEAADFAQGAAIAEKLLANTESVYIQIGAMYILSFLYTMLKRFDEASTCIVHCMDACAKAEDHKYEISLLMHELEMCFKNTEWIENKFAIEPSVHYTNFQMAYCNYFCIIQQCTRLSSESTEINVNPYEVALGFLEKEGYEFLAMQTHFYISLLYAAKGDEKTERFHLKRAIDIAVKNNTYTSLAGLAYWIPDALNSALKDYPDEVIVKFNNLMKHSSSCCSDFKEFTGGTSLFTNLTSDDYVLIYYCLRKYTSKMISDKLGISYSKARIKLKDLYNKLNVKTKSELISAYSEAIVNTNLIG